MIKGILFDKDGTLIEFESMWHGIMKEVFKQIEELIGLKREEIQNLKRISGYTEEGFLPESVIQYVSTRKIIELWVKHLDADNINDNVFEEIFDIFEKVAIFADIDVNLLDGVAESLDYFYKKGYYLGIATADTKSSAVHSLCQAKIFQYFSFIGADDGEMRAKPSTDMADRFCELVGISKDELLIVGDSVNDYNFAKASGAEFIGIDTEYNRLHQIEGDKVVLVKSLIDIIKEKGL
ncbi:HAD family hydrolase [Clostridium sp. DL1XJH146]